MFGHAIYQINEFSGLNPDFQICIGFHCNFSFSISFFIAVRISTNNQQLETALSGNIPIFNNKKKEPYILLTHSLI